MCLTACEKYMKSLTVTRRLARNESGDQTAIRTLGFHGDLQLPTGQPEELLTVQIRQNFSKV